jgi:hypothetical protein
MNDWNQADTFLFMPKRNPLRICSSGHSIFQFWKVSDILLVKDDKTYDRKILPNHSDKCGSVWVWNLVSDIKGGT